MQTGKSKNNVRNGGVVDFVKAYEAKMAMRVMAKNNKELRESLAELKSAIHWIETELEMGDERLELLMKKFCEDIDLEDEQKKDEECYVYFIKSEGLSQVKIGVSNNPEARLKCLATAHGDELKILHTIKCKTRKDALEAEGFLHRYYSNFHKIPFGRGKVSGSEWFDSQIEKENRFYHTRPISYFDNLGKITEEKHKQFLQLSSAMEKIGNLL